MDPTSIEKVATVLFALAVVHTFACNRILHFGHRFPQDSIGRNTCHLLGEVEAVFGLWAGILLMVVMAMNGGHGVVAYMDKLNFTEPAFVFVIMTVASTRPVIDLAGRLISLVASVLFFIPREAAMYFSALVLGPLLGSFITEPAAMTVTALILKQRYYDRDISDRLKYLTIAVLFVNVSIGGVLTPYAAPPVLMVAGKWEWDISFMLAHFGWKSALACVINAALVTLVNFREIRTMTPLPAVTDSNRSPLWLIGVHVVFLAAIVMSSHHLSIFVSVFLFFMGATSITKKYQSVLNLRSSLMVSFFLGGLVILGGMQSWWIEPLLKKMGTLALFLGCTALTAITDNAALTYLGSQVTDPSMDYKYALVAGAIAGGGLTVIANAPNPAGFSILQERFGEDGINSLKLFLAALLPTLIAMGCLWLLPR